MTTAIIRLCSQCQTYAALSNSDHCQQCAAPEPFFSEDFYNSGTLVATLVGNYEGQYTIAVASYNRITQNWTSENMNIFAYLGKYGLGVTKLFQTRLDYKEAVIENEVQIEACADYQATGGF